jgi:gluconolactonase
VVDQVDGLPLNSPNDVVVRADGTIWFTDPSYGYLQGFRHEPAVPDRVYRIDPLTGVATAVADGFDKPNGLAFSLDQRTLYVADNGAPHHLLAFDVQEDGSLSGRRIVAIGTHEHPDGLKVDAEDRIYASSRDGIQIFAPSGELLGEIELPGAVNFTFGGRGGHTLYITADTALWAVHLNAKGA